MSALAFAPFNDENNETPLIQKKRNQQNNRTQKNYTNMSSINNDKVNSVLQAVHDQTDSSANDGNSLGDYFVSPPPPPTSIGSEKAKNKESSIQNTAGSVASLSTSSLLSPNLSELNNFNHNYGDETSANDYYKQYIPQYNGQAQAQAQPQKNATFPSSTSFVSYQNSSHDLMMKKLNYMIHLLEEKHDEKTNNVMEEVVLYSFLGIFIIFIVDSFTRVGKYTR